MSTPGSDWTRFVSAPDGVTADRLAQIFLCDRLVIRRSLLSPLPSLKLYDEQSRCVATARRRFGLREEIRVRAEGPGDRDLLRISRDNPRIELEPSFRVSDPFSDSVLGRFEILDPIEAPGRRHWQIRDRQGEAIGHVEDPMSWPQLPCRLDFGVRGAVTIEPVFSLARPTYSVRLALGPRETMHRVLGVGLAVLLIAIRKAPPPMPGVPPGPAGS